MNSISENSSDRYVLEDDHEYSDELHELHNDYLLFLEKHEISHNMLLNYCSSIGNEYFIQMGGVNELVSNLDDKFI